MNKKQSVLVLCGGQSTEHEISIRSANNIIAALDADKYHIAVVYITQQGAWYYTQNIAQYLAHGPQYMLQQKMALPVTCLLGGSQEILISLTDERQKFAVDCVFPVLHGTYGEDGCIQGLLALLNVAYVGAEVLSSAMCMDKDITKQLLTANGIATTPWLLLTADHLNDGLYPELTKALGPELFVKPASLGSSVGVVSVKTEAEFLTAARQAFRYDRRVLVEKRIYGREIECAVLGNADPIAALPGEIICQHGYYTYDTKYRDANVARVVVPASLPPVIVERVRQIAIEVFNIMQCAGMLRVDFFVVDEQTVLVNEVNTIPGFTNISLYPQMWQAAGITYTELLDQLIELALQRYQQCSQLVRIYPSADPIVADQKSSFT